MIRAIHIPANPDKPITWVTFKPFQTLEQLYAMLDCRTVEAVPCPSWPQAHRKTTWIDEEGKGVKPINTRAALIMRSGIDHFPGDYVAGDLVITGHDPGTGDITQEPPHELTAHLEAILGPIAQNRI